MEREQTLQASLDAQEQVGNSAAKEYRIARTGIIEANIVAEKKILAARWSEEDNWSTGSRPRLISLDKQQRRVNPKASRNKKDGP